jgi:DNA-binding response OmpR family regulator
MSNILIVEDEHISAQYLKKILEENNLKVCAIEDNAEDALQATKKLNPDLLLLDIMLYGQTSGCELALEIREFNNEIIIIFLSAYADDEMLEYALNVDAYSYLLKPYRDQEIITTIKMALQQHRSEKHFHSISLKNRYTYHITEARLLKKDVDTMLNGKRLELIAILAQKRAQAISLEEIAHKLYGDNFSINTLRSLVHRIKQNFPDLQIHNVPKKGYVLY